MNRFLKWVIGLLAVALVAVSIYSYKNDGLFSQRLSPEKTVSFQVEDIKLQVFYNRPSKRDREVFGALVPYNQVWRTGANEATTFETNKPLKIGKDSLPAGKYTIWTIPNDTAWNVMFNSKQYSWGVDMEMKPMRVPEFDIVNISVPVKKIDTTVEQFTIGFDNSTDNLSLTMAWDNTMVVVPLK
ncbi:DUF2911 domain-containing protein [Oceanihabitans sp. 2_MG-2023]|uniref:DUF2911 domain-containing protein n=1 Tax=Oceanihabitans sp. 2_MG-2023 TaxID=3062661 RepID=UPI0026E30C12|nr:DUF2911 domain-containing protein [Oceanihabitans sp. 2_MG-2023]MDO6597655.1 DUF2911 domain-containing protein [Oceanihabitans sp. 2_MG-2023]